jgi:hypothetical protein
MATNKKLPKVEELSGYFFMSVQDKQVELVYHDSTDKGLALGAALASVLEEDVKLFDIFSSAFLTALDARNEKYNSKKSNKVPKKPVKSSK